MVFTYIYLKIGNKLYKIQIKHSVYISIFEKKVNDNNAVIFSSMEARQEGKYSTNKMSIFCCSPAYHQATQIKCTVKTETGGWRSCSG